MDTMNAYADEAIEDLEAIRRWQMQPGSGPAAIRRLRAIRAEIKRLKRHPCPYPPGPHPGVREMRCEGGCRALYRVTPDTGWNDTAGDARVPRVYGPGQDRRTFEPSALRGR